MEWTINRQVETRQVASKVTPLPPTKLALLLNRHAKSCGDPALLMTLNGDRESHLLQPPCNKTIIVRIQLQATPCLSHKWFQETAIFNEIRAIGTHPPRSAGNRSVDGRYPNTFPYSTLEIPCKCLVYYLRCERSCFYAFGSLPGHHRSSFWIFQRRKYSQISLLTKYNIIIR